MTNKVAHSKDSESNAATTSHTSGGDASTFTHPFLGHEMRIELSDGRILIGILIAFLGNGDMVLSNVLERCTFKDGATVMHTLSIVAVPFKHVKQLHRRLPGHPPITLTPPDAVNDAAA